MFFSFNKNYYTTFKSKSNEVVSEFIELLNSNSKWTCQRPVIFTPKAEKKNLRSKTTVNHIPTDQIHAYTINFDGFIRVCIVNILQLLLLFRS
jgi:hypothetical protein